MEQQHSTPRAGGYTDVAKELTTDARPVTRQQVYAWSQRSQSNGFPERVQVGSLWLFDLDAVAAWYRTYEPSTGGRPRRRGIENVVDDL